MQKYFRLERIVWDGSVRSRTLIEEQTNRQTEIVEQGNQLYVAGRNAASSGFIVNLWDMVVIDRNDNSIFASRDRDNSEEWDWYADV